MLNLMNEVSLWVQANVKVSLPRARVQLGATGYRGDPGRGFRILSLAMSGERVGQAHFC